MTEIKCKSCGSTKVVEEEELFLCLDCGKTFTAEDNTVNEIVPSEYQTPQEIETTQPAETTTNEVQTINQPAENNPHEYDFNTQAQKPVEQKSIILSMLLAILFPGLGLAYLGLFKRWLISLGVSVIIGAIFFPLGIVWSLYILYHTYQCTNFINNGEAIPPLAGLIDIEG